LALVSYSEQAFRDFERISEFLAQDDIALAGDVVSTIVDAISVLERHPEIGRPAEQGLRELIISRGRTGYVALYSYSDINDSVVILALRHQNEAGYQDSLGEIW
jgi:plasmid stabilization system protein ParE